MTVFGIYGMANVVWHCYTCCMYARLVGWKRKKKDQEVPSNKNVGPPCGASSLFTRDQTLHPMKSPGATSLGVLSHSCTSEASIG